MGENERVIVTFGGALVLLALIAGAVFYLLR